MNTWFNSVYGHLDFIEEVGKGHVEKSIWLTVSACVWASVSGRWQRDE